MGSREEVRPAPGLYLRGGLMNKRKLFTLDVLSENKDTPGVAWFLLDDATYVEEKVIIGELASTWEEDVITVVRRVTLKGNAPS